MSTGSRSISRSCAGLLAALPLAAFLASSPAAAQYCASSADEDGCPFRCIGSLDPTGATPTDTGNWLCNTISRLSAVGQLLGEQSSAFVEPARKDLDDLVRVTFAGAVNRPSIHTYNSGLGRTEVIEGRMEDLLADPVCGSEAALAELQQFFVGRANDLVATGQIAGSLAQAVQALAPALTEITSALGQLQGIASGLVSPSSEQLAQLQALTTVLEAMRSRIEQLQSLDMTAVQVAGGEMGTTIAPFLVSCAGCSIGLAAPLGLLASAQAPGANVLPCPADWPVWGGTCWGTLTLGGAVSAAVLAGPLASPSCTAAAAGAGLTGAYLESIQQFLLTAVSVGMGIGLSLTQAVEAGDELQVLADLLGSGSTAQLQAIEQHLNGAIAALNQGAAVVAADVVPQLERFAQGSLQELGANVVKMTGCYNQLHGLATAISGDVMAGVGDLAMAGASLVDGGQIAVNLVTQGDAAIQAAADFAVGEFNRLSVERNRIHMELWGLPWPAIPSVQQVLGFPDVSLTPSPAGPVPIPYPSIARFVVDPPALLVLLGEIVELELAMVSIVPRAVQAGKAAFLDLDGDRDAAREHFDLAGVLAASALPKLDNPGTLPVASIPTPNLGMFATVDPKDIGPLTPEGPVQISYASVVLAEHMRAIRDLPVRVQDPDGRPVQVGTTCYTCPHEYTMSSLWETMDRARVRETVSIRLYSGRTMVADLGTHTLQRGGTWSSKSAVQRFTPPEGSRDPVSGCGYRVVVLKARGDALAETETCLARRE